MLFILLFWSLESLELERFLHYLESLPYLYSCRSVVVVEGFLGSGDRAQWVEGLLNCISGTPAK